MPMKANILKNKMMVNKKPNSSAQKEDQMAPTYVKFYKYEEVKQRHNMQNFKDKLRWKLFEKMKN